jgi:hypothetical protein
LIVTGEVTLSRALGEHELDAVVCADVVEGLEDEEQELRITAVAPNEITTEAEMRRRRSMGPL